MANVIINEQHLIDIADAIRHHTGSGLSYKPRDMAKGILDIPVGDNITFSEFIGRKLSGPITVVAPVIGQYALAFNNEVTALTTTATTLDKRSCSDNPALTTLTLMNHVERIDDNAFRDCSSLTNIAPISVDFVGSYAFAGCNALTKIEFTKLDSFEDGIFGYVSNGLNDMALNTIIIRDYPPKLLNPYSGEVNSCPFPARFKASYTGGDKGYIYVPAAYLEDYMLDTYNYHQDFWKQFSYRAIEDYPNI